MVALVDEPTVLQILLTRAGKAITRRREASRVSKATVSTWYVNTVRFVLHVAGLSSLTYAGFEWSTIAGYVAAGASCFVLSTLITSPATAPSSEHKRR